MVFFGCAELPEVGPLKPEDIELALRNTRPSAHLHAHRYEKFNQDYGSQVLCSEQAWSDFQVRLNLKLSHPTFVFSFSNTASFSFMKVWGIIYLFLQAKISFNHWTMELESSHSVPGHQCVRKVTVNLVSKMVLVAALKRPLPRCSGSFWPSWLVKQQKWLICYVEISIFYSQENVGRQYRKAWMEKPERSVDLQSENFLIGIFVLLVQVLRHLNIVL